MSPFDPMRTLAICSLKRMRARRLGIIARSVTEALLCSRRYAPDVCGIFGTAGDPDRVAGISEARALWALRHRGPDGEGTHRSTSAGGETACLLVHARLAILDLSEAGRQPMSTPDGRYTMTFNGEVYNFADVRRDLEAEGERFTSTGDTEVLLRAYARWGAACVPRFRGMFALAIWDEIEGTLFLARDRLGIKPLYYRVTHEGIAIASEVRALLATGTAERRLSAEGLRRYLETGSVQDPDTLVEGVFNLLPGHTLTWTRGDVRTEKYWSIPPPSRVLVTDPREAAQLLGQELETAVRLRLISDVPVGVFLSGGYDSSAIALLAARAASGPLMTFNVAFDEASLDESRFARQVAEKLGARHEEIRLSSADVLLAIEPALAAQDQPSADGINTWVVSRAVRNSGLKVALSGLGGDEVFAGYRNFRSFGRVLAGGRGARAVPAVLRAQAQKRLSGFGVPTRVRKALLLASAGGDPERSYAALRGMFSPAEVDRLMRGGLRQQSRPANPKPETEDSVNLYSRMELEGYLRNTLLRDADQMSMAHALEVRVPLIDHALVETAFRVSGTAKIAQGRQKPLLVDGVPGLADLVAGRPKMRFVLPFESWFRGPLKAFVEDLLGNGTLASVLGGTVVEEVREGFFGRGSAFVSYSRVATLVSLSAWLRRFGQS